VNPQSIDTDIHTQVVGWDKYLDRNISEPSDSIKNSPLKPKSGNVFDSLFTNSFLHTTTKLDKSTTPTKPPRNILGRKKSSLKISSNNKKKETQPLSTNKKVTFESKGTNTEQIFGEVKNFVKEIQDCEKPNQVSYIFFLHQHDVKMIEIVFQIIHFKIKLIYYFIVFDFTKISLVNFFIP